MSATTPSFSHDLSNEREPADSTLALEWLTHDDYVERCNFDSTGRIIGLDLEGCTLPNPELELGADFAALQVLNLGRTNLRQLRFSVALPHLRDLRLYECKDLTTLDLPADLSALQYLDVSECALSSLHLPGLQALEKLYLQKNGLQHLDWPAACPQLVLVDLSENQLESLVLPAGLEKLRFLYLKDNQLHRLNAAGSLPALQVLHLRNNQLEDLSLVFVQGGQMETLYLHENPLSRFPREIITDGERGNSLKEVRGFLLQLQVGEIVNYRAKLIVVGNGRVGKTSICKQLKQGENFNPKEEYTHGIRIGNLSKLDFPDLDAEDLYLNVWDFGGQEIFYATHQFFLSEEAIYLLAWTSEENVKQYRQESGLPADEKWRVEEYWLENIRLYGKESPVLVVRTHFDCDRIAKRPEIGQDVNLDAVEFVNNFSALKGTGLSTIKEIIAQKLSELPLFGEKFPKSYDLVIQEMENAEDEVITLERFNQICAEKEVLPGNESNVLAYLHKAGVVVYFNENDLNDVVFTNPNWLTTQVYRLINNALQAKQGKIDPVYLQENLPDYSEQERRRFVALLKAFKLIFAVEGESQVYIAPQYLPSVLDSATRDLYESHKEDFKQVAFFFRFPRFMPDNVMINFLSEYGPYSRKMYWRNGIFFRKNDQKCVVELDESTRTLHVYAENTPEGMTLQREICEAFVELSRKAQTEISLDGKVYVSWQELKRQYDLYQQNPAQNFYATDGTTMLSVRDFAQFFEKGEFGKGDTVSVKAPTIESVKELIGKSRTKEALATLLKIAPDDFKNDVRSFQARLTNLKRREIGNSQGHVDIGVEASRLNTDILDFCDLLED